MSHFTEAKRFGTEKGKAPGQLTVRTEHAEKLPTPKMAKNTNVTASTGISRAQLKSFIVEAGTLNREAGEVFSGMNVLKLQPGQAAQGMVIAKIGIQIVKGRGKEKGKKREIPSYAAKAPDGTEYRLPLNRSFVDKAVEAKLAVGDTITLIAEDAYVSKDGNKGMGFSLIVTARAETKAKK